MSRFPALKTIAIVLKILAILSVAGGIFLAFERDELLMRIGALGGGLLAALLLWALSELIAVAISIESNTFLAQKALNRSTTVSWTPASSRPSTSSPDAGLTSV